LIELTEYAGKDVRLCVENNRLDKMAMEVLEDLLPAGNLFLAWDIPKSHDANGEPIVEVENFLKRHLGRVKECHLHDQKPGNYSHDALGVGGIDFSHYLKLLLPQDVNFTLEIRPREDALKSLRALKTMLNSLGWKMSSHA